MARKFAVLTDRIGDSQGEFMKLFWIILVMVVSLARAEAASDIANLPAAQVCATCHGGDGNSLIPANPRLAGQHAAYLAKQINEFKSGKRSNPIMSAVVANLSKDDVNKLVAHYASQTPGNATAHDHELATKGQNIYRGGIPEKSIPACSACHSPDGAGIPAQYPRLSGQHADYTAAQLKTFRAGDRSNDENSVMRAVAARLTDREIAQLAEYIAGLH
jgi:cytochrome c553